MNLFVPKDNLNMCDSEMCKLEMTCNYKVLKIMINGNKRT
jgi:hypothetical protein